jgi:signal transduction histidine kinase
MTVAAVVGSGLESLRGTLVDRAPIAAQVMATGAPIAIADSQLDPQVSEQLRLVGVGPALYVPLGTAADALGVLIVGRIGGRHEFGEDVLRVVESFAGQAAIALRLGTAAEDREQLAVLGDRDRIARDLHDLVIQRLFATGMSLEGAVRGMSPDHATRVRQAVDDLDQTIKEVRSSIFALQQPAPFAGEGLRSVVLGLLHEAARSLGFAPSVTFRGPVDTLVTGPAAEQLLAVLREALSNVARHAKAGSARIEIAADENRVELVVRDDGIGIAQGSRRSGLANMESRARDLSGWFTAKAGDTGTVVTWCVPLSA